MKILQLIVKILLGLILATACDAQSNYGIGTLNRRRNWTDSFQVNGGSGSTWREIRTVPESIPVYSKAIIVKNEGGGGIVDQDEVGIRVLCYDSRNISSTTAENQCDVSPIIPEGSSKRYDGEFDRVLVRPANGLPTHNTTVTMEATY